LDYRMSGAQLNDAQRELWTRLEGLALDDPSAVLTFSRRLARENRWTLVRAGRVVTEYKRFVFLAMEAGHPVSPSEDVDQAWHLHLTYTESYWQDMCAGVLGRRLHHHPTKGGADEAHKFDGMYARTLDSYQRLFGEAPPADIWPRADEKNHAAATHRWVDLSAHWVFPKKWLAPAAILALAVTMGLLLPGCQGDGLNPFSLSGTDFLTFYFFVLLFGLPLAAVARHALSGPHGEPKELPTDAYEVAYLVGGGPRMFQTALVSLHVARAAEILTIGQGGMVRRTDTPATDLHDVEVLLWGCLPKDGRPVKLESLADGLRPAGDKVAARLLAKGLFSVNASHATAIATAMAFSIPAFGFIRVAQSLANGRPVMWLSIMCLAGTAVAGMLMFTWRKSRRSGRGSAALRALWKIHEKQNPKAHRPAQRTIPVGLATALFGLAVLPHYQLGALREQLKETASGAWADGGAGCGSSCGGDGGGCGGGCGGCGD
jgi:uncharacterized protein (TIGR04222 family)